MQTIKLCAIFEVQNPNHIIYTSYCGQEKYEQGAKCPRVLYVKPSNKGFIIPLEKTTSKFGFSIPSARKPVKPGLYSAIHNFTV